MQSNLLLSPLQTIFADRSVEGAVRWMAITCLKNGIDCYWRPNAPQLVVTAGLTALYPSLLHSAISDEEKAIVRSALLSCLEEPVQQVTASYHVALAGLVYTAIGISAASCVDC